MCATALGDHTALRRAVKEANAEQVWLKDILKRVRRLPKERRHRRNAYWATVKLVEHHLQQLSIRCVEPSVINLKSGKRRGGSILRDLCGAGHLNLITYATKETICNPWRPAASRCNQCGRIFRDADAKDPSRTLHDFGELAVRIEVEALRCTETIAEWRREHPDARGCSDQREGRHLKAQRLRRGSLPNHDVNGTIFHGWIEDLFHGASEAMNLVNKEHLSWRKVRQDCGEISAMVNRRS